MLICFDHRTGSGCGHQNRDGARHCNQCGLTLRFALQLQDPGATIGRYTIVRVIGHGGAGAVYEAAGAGRPAALKETFDPQGVRSLQGEFEVLSRLSHPNLPRYDEIFEEQGNGYMVMEYVPGQSLEEVLWRQGGPLLESQVLGYALQLCEVLAYLHALRPAIVHRDIKPANIRLTPEGLIKLVDFGLLKQAGAQTRHTIRGFGTPEYAPLEQFGSSGTDTRSDIFSLGATLYHLLTGEAPPPAPNRIAAASDLLLPAAELVPGLSSYVSGAVTRALALLPKDRFQTIAELKAALLGGAELGSAAAGPPVAKPASAKRQRPAASGPGATPTPSAISRPAAPAQRKRPAPDARNPAGTAPLPSPRLVVAPPAPPLPTLPAPRLLYTLSHPDLFRRDDALSWRADGELLASNSAGTVQLWSPRSADLYLRSSIQTLEAQALAWSPDGQLIALGGGRTVELWAVDGTPLKKLAVGGKLAGSSALAWSDDGATLAVACADKTVRLIAADDGRLVQEFNPVQGLLGYLGALGEGVEGLAWGAQGLVASTLGSRLYLWRAADGQVEASVDLDAFLRGEAGASNTIYSLAASPDRATFATASYDGRMRLWNSRLSPKRTLVVDLMPLTTVCWSPDGVFLATSSSSRMTSAAGFEHSLLIWREADGALLHEVPRTNPISRLAWSPAGGYLASTGEGYLQIWRVG